MKEHIVNEECVATSNPKHIYLHDAVLNLNDIVEHLDGLIEQIRGPIPREGGDDNKKSCPPTLHEVLSNAPRDIEIISESAHCRIREISDLLF